MSGQTYVFESDGASIPAGEYLVWIGVEGLVELSYREHSDRAWGPPEVPLGTLIAKVETDG